MTVKELKEVLKNFKDTDEVMIWDYADRLQPCVLECRENILAFADKYHYTTEEQNAMRDAYSKVNNI